jgi:proteasome lid subunit RPN8/RPN11
MIKLLNNHLRSEIRKHAKEERPRECCGIIVDNGQDLHIVQCKNVAKHKDKRFEISSEDYLNALNMGKIRAYYHSHTNGNSGLSMPDILVSLAHNVKLIMYCLENDGFTEHEVEDWDNE